MTRVVSVIACKQLRLSLCEPRGLRSDRAGASRGLGHASAHMQLIHGGAHRACQPQQSSSLHHSRCHVAACMRHNLW